MDLSRDGNRSFAPGRLDRSEPGPAPRLARFTELSIDETTRSIERPPHVQLDFGGFLKGRTVDRAAELTPSPAVIDAGGDARLIGAGIDGAGWLVEIEDPDDQSAVLLTLRVTDRAIATSAANRRRWRLGRTMAHHLIDPGPGRRLAPTSRR